MTAGQPIRRGRLTDEVPAGEVLHGLAAFAGVRVEHIVSSASPDETHQVQTWDEWVLVVAGGALLEVSGVRVELGVGDWITIPAGTSRRVSATQAGTQWIAVHGPASVDVPPPTGPA